MASPLLPAWPQALSAQGVSNRELVPGAPAPPLPSGPSQGTSRLSETLHREPPWPRGPQGQANLWGRSAACWWGWHGACVPSSSHRARDGAWQWLCSPAGCSCTDRSPQTPCLSVVNCESRRVQNGLPWLQPGCEQAGSFLEAAGDLPPIPGLLSLWTPSTHLVAPPSVSQVGSTAPPSRLPSSHLCLLPPLPSRDHVTSGSPEVPQDTAPRLSGSEPHPLAT